MQFFFNYREKLNRNTEVVVWSGRWNGRYPFLLKRGREVSERQQLQVSFTNRGELAAITSHLSLSSAWVRPMHVLGSQ